MNQAAEAEFMGVPGSELPVRQTRREGPAMLLDRTMAAIFCRRRSGLTAMLLRLDGDGDLRQQEGRGCSRKLTFAAHLGRRLDGDLRQQEAVTRG